MKIGCLQKNHLQAESQKADATVHNLYGNWPEPRSVSLNWAEIDLPNSWVDSILNSGFWQRLKFLLAMPFTKPKHFILPEGVPGAESIPRYALQPFHNLPNGNYSKRISRGYVTGFDRVMLNETYKLRDKLAEYFHGCHSVLDVGCAGGKLAHAIKTKGVEQVWGLDPSPYLLQHAAVAYPDINFVQGVVEELKFESESFDGIAACFLFHEIPPKYIKQGLREIYRVLKSGGTLAFCEPSRIQYEWSWKKLFHAYGLKGLYFKFIALRMYEPFLQAWHKSDVPALLKKAGFQVVRSEESMPAAIYVAKKV